MVSGTLIIRPKNATLTYDTETFGKMDPYIVVNVGTQKFTSAVADDAGKNPLWYDQFNAKIANETLISFSIFDKDNISKDDFIAEGQVSLANALSHHGKSIEHVQCNREGKSAGQVVFEFEFVADGHHH